MSSDNYLVRIDERSGATVTIRFVVTGNGGFSGEPRPGGRSLVLLAAFEADPTALGGRSTRSPLFRCLVADADLDESDDDAYAKVWDKLRDAAWIEARIDHYVTSVKVTHARMLAGDWEDERAFASWMESEATGEDSRYEALLWQVAPYFDCIVEFADARYADHLARGRTFGTAAYASWREPASARMQDAPQDGLEIFVVDSDGKPE